MSQNLPVCENCFELLKICEKNVLPVPAFTLPASNAQKSALADPSKGVKCRSCRKYIISGNVKLLSCEIDDLLPSDSPGTIASTSVALSKPMAHTAQIVTNAGDCTDLQKKQMLSAEGAVVENKDSQEKQTLTAANAEVQNKGIQEKQTLTSNRKAGPILDFQMKQTFTANSAEVQSKDIQKKQTLTDDNAKVPVHSITQKQTRTTNRAMVSILDLKKKQTTNGSSASARTGDSAKVPIKSCSEKKKPSDIILLVTQNNIFPSSEPNSPNDDSSMSLDIRSNKDKKVKSCQQVIALSKHTSFKKRETVSTVTNQNKQCGMNCQAQKRSILQETASPKRRKVFKCFLGHGIKSTRVSGDEAPSSTVPAVSLKKLPPEGILPPISDKSDEGTSLGVLPSVVPSQFVSEPILSKEANSVNTVKNNKAGAEKNRVEESAVNSCPAANERIPLCEMCFQKFEKEKSGTFSISAARTASEVNQENVQDKLKKGVSCRSCHKYITSGKVTILCPKSNSSLSKGTASTSSLSKTMDGDKSLEVIPLPSSAPSNANNTSSLSKTMDGDKSFEVIPSPSSAPSNANNTSSLSKTMDGDESLEVIPSPSSAPSNANNTSSLSKTMDGDKSFEVIPSPSSAPSNANNTSSLSKTMDGDKSLEVIPSPSSAPSNANNTSSLLKTMDGDKSLEVIPSPSSTPSNANSTSTDTASNSDTETASEISDGEVTADDGFSPGEKAQKTVMSSKKEGATNVLVCDVCFIPIREQNIEKEGYCRLASPDILKRAFGKPVNGMLCKGCFQYLKARTLVVHPLKDRLSSAGRDRDLVAADTNCGSVCQLDLGKSAKKSTEPFLTFVDKPLCGACSKPFVKMKNTRLKHLAKALASAETLALVFKRPVRGFLCAMCVKYLKARTVSVRICKGIKYAYQSPWSNGDAKVTGKAMNNKQDVSVTKGSSNQHCSGPSKNSNQCISKTGESSNHNVSGTDTNYLHVSAPEKSNDHHDTLPSQCSKPSVESDTVPKSMRIRMKAAERLKNSRYLDAFRLLAVNSPSAWAAMVNLVARSIQVELSAVTRCTKAHRKVQINSLVCDPTKDGKPIEWPAVHKEVKEKLPTVTKLLNSMCPDEKRLFKVLNRRGRRKISRKFVQARREKLIGMTIDSMLSAGSPYLYRNWDEEEKKRLTECSSDRESSNEGETSTKKKSRRK